MGRFVIYGAHLAVLSLMPLAVGSAYAADPPTSTKSSFLYLDQTAGTWRPWVLTSGKEMRLEQPPDDRGTAGELEALRALKAKADDPMHERVQFWNHLAPSYRWNEVLTDLNAAAPFRGGGTWRAFAMMNVALHDAMIAAWDTKFAFNRKRPGELDPDLQPAVATPPSPSYPCEYSVAAGAASAVIAHLYPAAAQKVNAAAEEAAQSRVIAGVAFPSDARMGLELGRAVAARVIEHMKISGEKSTASVPTGPGIWKGTNPVGVDETTWKTFVLTSPDRFRPPPPPAHDSPELAAELAEVKNFKRTPFTNSKVFFWQFGQQGQPGIIFRMTDEVGKRLAEEGAHVSPPRAARAYALIHVAHYDGWVASQDAKFHYWAARPHQFDATISQVIPTPPFPTYPSNAATLVTAPAVVLGFLFPREKERYEGWAKEFGESRIWAGIHFRSDIDSGNEIGRKLGEAVVARAKADGADTAAVR